MLDVATLADHIMAARTDRAAIVAMLAHRDSLWRDHLEAAAAGFGALRSINDVEAARRVAAMNHTATRDALRLPPAISLR